MKNEMTLDKTGLTIPSSELAECAQPSAAYAS